MFLLGEEEEELRAHKLFLLSASPIFHQIFTEASTKLVELRLKQVSKATMTELCRFAYSENVKLTQDNMLDILHAASKFEMKILTEKVIDFICKQMNEHSVFKILILNQVHGNMRISMSCFDYIKKHYVKCLRSTDFLELPSDLLKIMLQTCKIPKSHISNAITNWSTHPDNGDHELDELMALVDLNEETTDKENDYDSDGASSAISGVSSKASGNSKRRQKGGKPNKRLSMPQQNRIPNCPPFFTSPPFGIQFPMGQKFAPMQHQQGPQQLHRPQNQHRPQQQHRPPQQQQNKPSPTGNPQQQHNNPRTLNAFAFQGSITRKNYKIASLDLTTMAKMIFIQEIHFIHDLSTIDQGFTIRITNMTEDNRRVDLFYDNVNINTNKVAGPYMKYVLPRKCQLFPKKNISIFIEFAHEEFRPTFENWSVSFDSIKDRLQLNRSANSNGQIISKLHISDN